MRRVLAWTLIVVPGCVIGWVAVSVGVEAVTGRYVENELGTALGTLALLTLVAAVPVGAGSWLLLGDRARPGARGGGQRSRADRRLLGWILVVAGLVPTLLLLGAGATRSLVQALGVALLLAGVGVLVAERRRTSRLPGEVPSSREPPGPHETGSEHTEDRPTVSQG